MINEKFVKEESHSMSNQKYHPFFWGATALAAGLLGTFKSLLGTKKPETWTDSAKELAQHMLNESRSRLNAHMVLGGLAGGLVAVTTALLLAPKPGKELIEDMMHPFTPSKSAKVSSHPRKKIAARHPKGAPIHSKEHHEEGHKIAKSGLARAKNGRRATAARSAVKKRPVQNKIVEATEKLSSEA
jgi:gas vesicle protein